jgi:hypothetical protein
MAVKCMGGGKTVFNCANSEKETCKWNYLHVYVENSRQTISACDMQ